MHMKFQGYFPFFIPYVLIASQISMFLKCQAIFYLFSFYLLCTSCKP